MISISSCITEPEIEKDKLFIYLDKTSYMLNEGARLTISNFSDVDLIMLGCGVDPELEVEKNLNNKWIYAGRFSSPCLPRSNRGSVVIKKGSTFISEIEVPDLETAGTYRLKLFVYRSDNKNMLNENLRVSKPFKIKTVLKH